MEGASRYERDRETTQQNQDGPHCPDDVKGARQAGNFKNARSMGWGILGGTTRRWRNSPLWYCCPSTTYYGFYLAKFADFFRRKRAPLSQRTLRRKKIGRRSLGNDGQLPDS